MRIKNYSGKSPIVNFNTRGMNEIIFLPDYSPGKGLIPTGIVVVYGKEHICIPDYLGSDVGCGMRLLDLKNFDREFVPEVANTIASYFLNNTREMGSLGKGNHFLTFYQGELNKLYALIHSGSRKEGIRLANSGLRGDEYVTEHNRVMEFARKNRKAIQGKLEEKMEQGTRIILDSPHNFLEVSDNEFIYRKGASRVLPEQIHIIPSSMGGDAVLISATNKVGDTRNSLCHGTGRRLSRSESKEKRFFEQPEATSNFYFPYFLSLEHFASELPQCYNSIDDILPKIDEFVQVKERLKSIASVMI